MVAYAVPVFAGRRVDHHARPMLRAANRSFLDGAPYRAAVQLREALRRHQAARCALHGLDDHGDHAELAERLGAAGAACRCVADLVLACDDVLTLASPPATVRHSLEMAFVLIGPEDSDRGGLA